MSNLAERMQLAWEYYLSQPGHEGHKYADLARAVKVKPPSVNGWFTGTTKALKSQTALAVAKFLGISQDWLVSGAGTMLLAPNGKEKREVAHKASLGESIVPFQIVEWGVNVNDLPERFALIARDDSMSPLLEQGQTAYFSTSKTPAAGKPVLLTDKHGDWYIRDFSPKSARQWTAKPRNTDYDPQDSIEDGLTVVAVMIGVVWEV